MTQALAKALAFVVEGDAPGVARPLAEELESRVRGWMRKMAQVKSYVLPSMLDVAAG